MEGWISLHRRFLNWEWYDDNNTMKLFIHILLKANHKKKNWKGIVIDKGQLLTGRKQLSYETKLSEQQIRTSLKKLISTNELTIKTTNLYSLVSITNWNKYQGNNQPITNEQPTNNQQVTTTNNVNNEKNVNNDNKEDHVFSEKDEKFKLFLCDKFGVNEIKQPRHYMNIVQSIDFMNGEGEEINRHFRDQCFYYFKYKELAEEKKHTSVSTFLFDTEIAGYRDSLMAGGWNKCNWLELGQSKFKSKYYEDGITAEDVLNSYK